MKWRYKNKQAAHIKLNADKKWICNQQNNADE